MAKQDLTLNLKQKAKELRKDIIDIVYKAQSGHPGGSLSAIDMLVGLYNYKLKIEPKNPMWQERDRVYSEQRPLQPCNLCCSCRQRIFS